MADKTVTVCYFAILQEQAGTDRQQLTTSADRLADLFEQLRRQHHFSLDTDSVRPAVNDRLADWSDPLHDGDCITFLPPMAGG